MDDLYCTIESLTETFNQAHKWLQIMFNRNPMSKDEYLFENEQLTPYELVACFGSLEAYRGKKLKEATWDGFDSIFGIEVFKLFLKLYF